MLPHKAENHAEACEILRQNLNWQYLPLVTRHPNVDHLHDCICNIQLPDVFKHVERSMKYHRYFTDGACINPTIADARISSWAVVRDMSRSDEHALAMTQLAVETAVMCPFLQVVSMGITPGRQTISRGELAAIVMAVECASLDEGMEKADIATDSQYAINVIAFLEKHDVACWGHKIANFDLVNRLNMSWDPKKFCAHKIQSHQSLESTNDVMQKRWIMGNMVADSIAAKAIQRCPKALLQMSHEIAEHQRKQAKEYQKVLRYLVELSGDRIIKMSLKEKEKARDIPSNDQRQFMAHDALGVLTNYTVGSSVSLTFEDVDVELLKGNLQGFNFGRLILQWAQTLTWPSENLDDLDEQTAMVAGWGCSWLELYANFYILTKQRCPLRLSGSLADTIFISYDSDEAKLLPTKDRSGMNQCTAFQSAVRCVESVLRRRIFPELIKTGSTSLHRFGFLGQIGGISIRPVMQQQALTTTTVFDYITSQVNKRKLRLVFPDIEGVPTIRVDPLPEPSARDRFLEYKRIYGRRRYN